jgi:adenylate kinase family enzyme
MERRTDLGLLLLNAYNTGQSVTNEMYVSLLAPVIFSGHECRDKFLLTGFPEIIENVEAFEENCTIIKGIILATDEGETVKTNNELSLGNIDT